MKKLLNKIMISLLSFLLMFTSVPLTVYAGIEGNSREQNDDVLKQLTEFWGDEKTAEEAYSLLK